MENKRGHAYAVKASLTGEELRIPADRVRFYFTDNTYFDIQIEKDGALQVRTAGSEGAVLSAEAVSSNFFVLVPKVWDSNRKNYVPLELRTSDERNPKPSKIKGQRPERSKRRAASKAQT